MYFATDHVINYCDCDSNSRLKLSFALRYMQQASMSHLDALGYPAEQLYRENMVFLLSKICVRVHNMPRAAQPVTVGTAATMTRGARFVREFVMEDRDGGRMVSALSLWILVDPQTRRVLRPASFPYPLPFHDSLLNGAISDLPMPKPLEGEGGRRIEIPVRYSHIDTNDHVNNSCYADFVCDVLPYRQLVERGVETLVISFQNEARQGDLLGIRADQLAEGEYLIRGTHGGHSPGGNPCFEAFAVLGDRKRLENH